MYTDSKTVDFSLQALAGLEPGSDTRPLDLDQTPRSRSAQIEGSDTRYQSSVLIPLPALAEICERVGLVPRRR